MKRFGRFVLSAAACSLVTPSFAQEVPHRDPHVQLSTAQEGWAALRECARLDDEARHACTDDVLHRAGMLSSEALASAQRKRFGASLEKRARTEPEIEVTLAKVEEGGDGKLLLTTTEGAVWRQVESNPVRPLPHEGQTMTIERTSLGGFLCKPAKWVSFRCFRAQ